MSGRTLAKSTGAPISLNDEGQWSSFFNVRNSNSPDVISFEPATLQQIPLFRGRTHHKLREALDSTITHNDRGLDLSWINVHDANHMARVAAASHQVGTRLHGVKREQVDAIAFGTSVHDVGYTFPRDIKTHVNSGSVLFQQYGKNAQSAHPERGAQIFSDTMQRLRKDPIINEELRDWDNVEAGAHDAILYHSNGSAYRPDGVQDVVKLPRFFDKLDNTKQRVYPRHMNALRAVAHGQSVEEVQARVHRGIDVAIQSPSVDPGRPFEQIEERVLAIDPRYQHRVVPFAIIDQCLTFDGESADFVMHYAVHTDGVGQHLGVEYSRDHFLSHFDNAYGKDSMPRAAEVAYSIRKNHGKQASPDESSLTIMFHFSDGTTAERQYAPKFD